MAFVSLEQRKASAARLLVIDLKAILAPHLADLKVVPPDGLCHDFRASGTIPVPDDVPVARDELLRRADRAIAAVELAGWLHQRYPTVHIFGGRVWPTSLGIHVMWPACWVGFEILPSGS